MLYFSTLFLILLTVNAAKETVVCTSDQSKCPSQVKSQNKVCTFTFNSKKGMNLGKNGVEVWYNYVANAPKSYNRYQITKDGKLVLQGPGGKVVWSSGQTKVKSKTYSLILTNDCELKVTSKENKLIWKAVYYRCTDLCPSEIYNPVSKFTFKTQKNGNLVLFDDKNKVVWESKSKGKGKGPYKLIVQKDGTLVLYGNNKYVWSKRQSPSIKGRKGPYKLNLQDDGNLVLYGNEKYIWDVFNAEKAKCARF